MRTVLSLILLASLTTVGCHSADGGLERFIPADTIALARMRMDQVRTTPLYQKLRTQKRLSELDDLKARTGFDPTRDVSELLVASNGKQTVTMARGQFAPSDPDAKKTAYKGYTLYAHGDGAYVLIDNSTAIAGTQAAVRAAIDQFKSGAGRPGIKSLLARAHALPPQAQIWAVADNPEAFAGLASGNTAGNFNKIFGQIDHVSFTADLRNGLAAVATADCRTEPDAKSLGDAIRGIIGLGKLSVPQGQTDLIRLYDSVQVDQTQTSVKVRANIAPDLTDKLLQLTDTARGSRGFRKP
jgi:hypothetical protein